MIVLKFGGTSVGGMVNNRKMFGTLLAGAVILSQGKS